MKTILKVAGGLGLVVLALAVGAVSWLALRKPAQRPASSEKIEATPERLARGKYLVHHVSDCLGCHSDHTLAWALPVKPGTEGKGGFTFGPEFGFPGTVSAQNITSDPETGLGKWTDGEILRAMREGIDRNGEALFPMMPYAHLRSMSDEDAKSIVVYLRTLEPIRNQTPPKKIDFPVNYLVKFVPKPIDAPVTAPPAHDTVAYGKYLTTIGGCIECHTPHNEKNELVTDKLFGGGWEMKGPWGRNYTANLTPHPKTFIGRATRDEFIGRFRAFANMDATNAPTPPPGRNTIMPWLAYAGMSDQDLGAIYDYLKTVPAVDNEVKTFPDAQ
ncbi:MAG TPA: cytochrome C [Thermoanaerobaculia bacterium]